MKVGSLFAEIGFKVDDKSLETFTKTLQTVQKQINSGLKGLREYAKVAKEVSQSLRGITSSTIQRKIVAQKNATNAKNTSARMGTKNHPLLRAFSSVNFNTLFQGFGRVIGTILGGAYGGVVGGYIGKIADKVIGAIFRATTLLGRTILAGMRFGMAYRDYRNFTGRSTTALGGLMSGTFNTANMRPEDVLRDAASLETQYWDMILGGGNPALWQLLGLHPTGTGEVDLQNIISRIGAVTGNFENRGLARSLFKMAGLDEQYLNVALYRSGQTKPVFEEQINALLASTDAFERTNQTVREFEWIWEKFKSDFLVAFVNSGLFEKLRSGLLNLIENFDSFTQKISDFFTLISNFMDWVQTEWPEIFSSKETTAEERMEKRYMRDIKQGKSMFYSLVSNAITHPFDTLVGGMQHADTLRGYPQNNTMNNTINVNSAEEAVQFVNSVGWTKANSGYDNQQQKNDAFQSSYRGAF